MTVSQADIQQTCSFLTELLEQATSPEGLQWLTKKMEKINTPSPDKALQLAFSAAPRFVGKTKLALTKEHRQEANRLRKGFNPGNWTADQAARVLLLLSLPHNEEKAFLESINKLFSAADLGELAALYASLPLLPYPEAFRLRAAEGVRTNMGTVFDAIALENPYPAGYLEEGPWNQLVLKTVFVGKPLYRIYGLEERSNLRLARILSDYAHERWAAGRTVTPELWRPVGPFIDEIILKDIERVFNHPDEIQQEAAALACFSSSYVPAQEMLEAHPLLKHKIESGELTWDLIGNRNLAFA
ncbi:EboA domain-containing protein [Pontibacter vulgaris]|uniref:EboA domain-containing protein n=1 Tax=Pontibacter vulgaris TaxID=2905679 RepID=UPI001FA7164F|nr:EboA domain-containing protein [Pontibacter vulgaris]